jgi:hypothetical protein
MSDQPTVPAAPAAPAVDPAAPTTTDPAAAGPVDTGADAPPWGDPENFDPEKAWILIQGLRADKEKLSKRPALTDEQQAKLAEFDRLAEASKTDLERAQDTARKSEERAARLLQRTVAAEIKTLAEGFADPTDALESLDPKKYATDDGDVDTEAIKADLAELLERKPHWAKAQQRTTTMRPNPAQGRSGQPAPSRAEQIAAAQAAGDTRTVMRLKAAQAAESTTS